MILLVLLTSSNRHFLSELGLFIESRAMSCPVSVIGPQIDGLYGDPNDNQIMIILVFVDENHDSSSMILGRRASLA